MPVFFKDASNVITVLRQLSKSPGCCGCVRLHTRIIIRIVEHALFTSHGVMGHACRVTTYKWKMFEDDT